MTVSFSMYKIITSAVTVKFYGIFCEFFFTSYEMFIISEYILKKGQYYGEEVGLGQRKMESRIRKAPLPEMEPEADINLDSSIINWWSFLQFATIVKSYVSAE